MRITFNYFPGGKKKAVAASYDDGRVSDRRLVEIFNRYGIRGTFHLNSGGLDSPSCISGKEIMDLYEGHEVSAHTVTHPFLTAIPRVALAEEVLEDRRILEGLAGCPVRGMSYPFGAFNDEIINALPSFGIEYSRTVLSHGRFDLPESFLAWHPTCHHGQNLLEKFREFQNAVSYGQPLLFFVWGHSYEFDRDGNWDLIEEFSKTAGGDEAVWHATCIEIVDYMNAVKNLIFSVDRKIVLNNSSIPVWIGVGGAPVEIKPGKMGI